MKLKTTILGRIIVCGIALCTLTGATNPKHNGEVNDGCESNLHAIIQKTIDAGNRSGHALTERGRFYLKIYQDILDALRNPAHNVYSQTVSVLDFAISELNEKRAWPDYLQRASISPLGDFGN